MLSCPFCGVPETERLEIDGARYVLFPCMFTPRVEEGLTDDEIAERLARLVGPDRSAYFRRTCDALHVYVTKGEGARVLTGRDPEVPPPASAQDVP